MLLPQGIHNSVLVIPQISFRPSSTFTELLSRYFLSTGHGVASSARFSVISAKNTWVTGALFTRVWEYRENIYLPALHLILRLLDLNTTKR